MHIHMLYTYTYPSNISNTFDQQSIKHRGKISLLFAWVCPYRSVALKLKILGPQFWPWDVSI